ncbi:MAG: hypothetical protein SYC29_04750, partial [Planctomycetota bacterium]|nr:hypothetical protein [Planctomycetota bacterium]
AGHDDIYTGAGREADRWKLRLVGYDAPDAVFYIYSAHLKASQGSDNEQIRLEGVMAIRENADALGADSHIIYGGDMNFYDNGEPGYLEYLAPGAAQAFDPLGSGPWGGPAWAIKHSQSPRADSGGGLVGGGLDDRFDFQLLTAPMLDGEGVSLIENTYRSLGNDGDHYNVAINNGNNTYYPGDIPRSNALADDLHEASDHLPVVAEYQIPAVLWAAMPEQFGRVIENAEYEVQVTVMNTVDVVVAAAGDELDYTATGTGALSGQSAGSIPALGPADVVSLALDTSEVGPREGSALVASNSQGVQNGSQELPVSGTVVRPANASFAEDSDVDEVTIPWLVRSGTGLQVLEADVFNYAYDELQARLDVDGVDGVIDPIQFLGGLESGIGEEPATLSFALDTDIVPPGEYDAEIVIFTSDEDIPGEEESALMLTLEATVASTGDINGDGSVDTADLLTLLGAWGECPDPPADCPSDLDGDGLVNTADLLLLLGHWG